MREVSVARRTLLVLLAALATARADSMTPTITREQAIQIATKDAGGFLGTWVDAARLDEGWGVAASSKSANPPVLYVIDASSGRILFRTANADAAAFEGLASDDEKEGARVDTDVKLRVRVAKLAGWPPKLRGRRIAIEGALRLRLDPQGERGHLLLEARRYRAL